MNGLWRAFLISILTMSSTACLTMTQDFDKYGKRYEPLRMHLLTIGDDKQAVVSKIGDPGNVIGSKRFANGIIEVWAYERWESIAGPDRKEEEYWLYFLNGKLEQWGRPGDWAREADRIYEFRAR